MKPFSVRLPGTTTTIEAITREALQLFARQRVALAGFLLEIDDASSDPEVDGAWEQEIKARITAIDNGAIGGVPYQEVVREAGTRLAG
jgi:hypothetical protein